MLEFDGRMSFTCILRFYVFEDLQRVMEAVLLHYSCKQTVEKRILPILNVKFGSEWTYKEYTSRLKWFKQRYANYSKLMRHSSGFGWDPITKKFTATEEVWEDYFKVSFFLFKKYIYRKIMNINTSHFLYVLFIFYFH